MKNHLLIVVLLVLMVCCNGKNNHLPQFNNEIRLSSFINDAQDQILISEFVDSITFICLETNPNNLFNRTSFVKLTSEYIYNNNDCFEWDGRYVMRIGRKGQGPCEDPAQIISSALYLKDRFYTNGSKFIEYDKNGNCTGKEMSLYQLDGIKGIGRFINLTGFEKTGGNIIAFNHPDSVFFFNTDFEVINSYPTSMVWGRPDYADNLSRTNLTYYNDTVVFFHYYTDTVYHAINNTLIAKWIIKLDENDKLPTDFVYKNNELMNESFEFFQQGRLEDARICKDMSNKIYIRELYETDKYLVMMCIKAFFYREFRDIPYQYPYLVFYDKRTGKATASQKIIDDICGIDNFYPDSGICDNKMVMSIWPYQL